MPQGVTGPGGVPGPGGPHMVVQNTQGLQQLQPNPGKVLATILNTLRYSYVKEHQVNIHYTQDRSFYVRLPEGRLN